MNFNRALVERLLDLFKLRGLNLPDGLLEHLHKMSDLVRFDWISHIALFAIGGDERLALCVEKHKPRDSALLLAVACEQLLATLHAIRIDFHIHKVTPKG